VSAQSRTRNAKRADTMGAPAGAISGARPDSRVTVLAIEQALADLGIHAKLGDIVAKARLIKNEIIRSRSRRKPDQMC
jgi:hypothetical protein